MKVSDAPTLAEPVGLEEGASEVVSEPERYAPPPLGWGSHIPVTPEEDAYFAELAAYEVRR